MKSTIESGHEARACRPAHADDPSASCCAKPDCVSAQPIEVAVAMISMIAPESAAVSRSIGYARAHLNSR